MGIFAALAAAIGLTALAGWRSTFVAPSPTLLLLDRHGQYLAQVGGGEAADLGYWPADPAPPRVAQAILAIEDKRFGHHLGVDPAAVMRALWQRLSGNSRSGASTIAMQVARMQAPGTRTLPRKVLEALTAVIMTLRYGHDAVLSHYLKLIPFGNGSHGIAHAARWYLDKPIEDLSWAEIAFLVAIPQSPTHMNPFTEDGRSRAIGRGQRILAALRQGGVLQQAEFDLATRQIRDISVPVRATRPVEALHALLRIGDELSRHHYQGDPRVFTTLDLDVQRRVRDMAEHFLTAWSWRGAQRVSVVVVDRAAREVLAWIGSDDYFAKMAGAIDFAEVSRSPGSALKPFLYALAMDRGKIAANTVLSDLPGTIWGIENADHDYLGPMLPRQALANSRNVPAAWLVRHVGLEESYLFLSSLGLHDNRLPARHYGLALAIGAMPTTLERLVRAYGALADDGRLLDLVWWRGEERQPVRQLLSPATARQVTQFLSDPAARLPSFPRLGANEDGLAIAVKTGTSQGYRDAWAVAWTPRYLVGVWTGRARGTAMRNVAGAQSSADLAQEVLLDLHRRVVGSSAARGFPPPEGYRPVELCTQTGLRAANRCSEKMVEWFPAGRVPEEDDVFQTLRIDLRTGLLAAPWTPPDFIGERTFAALAPEYAAWGASRGLPYPPTELSPLDRPGREGGAHAGLVPGGKDRNADSRLAVLAPRDGLRLVRNPETPPEAMLLTLRASASPALSQIIWLVDGKVWRAASPREELRWPMEAGVHSFQIGTADDQKRSAAVTIEVR